MLHDAAQAVSVGGDQDALALLHLGNDHVVPVGQCALDGQLEGLKLGELLGLGSVGVARILDDVLVVGMAGLHRWWGGVEAAAPDLHLGLAVLGGRLGLVQASESTVVALVQTPGLLDGDLLVAAGLQDAGEGHLGAGQHRGVGHIELQTGLLDGFAGGQSLLLACEWSHWIHTVTLIYLLKP